MDIKALAQKYQRWIAEQNGRTYNEYDWDGYDYEQLVEASHKIEENDSVWNRVNVGEVSLSHSKVSYINGMTDQEREEFQQQQKENKRTLLGGFLDMLKGNNNEDDSETD